MSLATEPFHVDACTLPTAGRPLRVAEFNALFATSLRRLERVDTKHLRLTLAGAEGLEATTRDLAARESACCAFFTFTVTSAGEQVVLDVEVPDAQTAVLDGLAALAAGAAPSAAAR
ncbi:hypothetical protein [Pseudofrankia asymbiotica]|uniref:Arsenate reductase n=1 Tax=Pseudofrankia asymbiotica TaxID=1834516 RepID=A0A1V2IIA8_9ACTN|nr:hypothetical protein [Pseudofrankia asymbiotica]ONH32669.1 hypothetical protein BL253_04865 [Pseudofrankia asymbiotica]